MSGWSHGYNVSTGYTYGFYRETAPDWIDYALAMRGLITPRREGGEKFRYLELGSGQGFGLCLLAAANPEGEFLGIDFSPDQTAHAISLAADLGLTNIRFVEGDFADLGASWPAEHGRFDYVVLHGIYSWVPEAIRRSLVAILAAATNPGAAVYVSYNAMPGWASTMPFQHMLRLLEEEGVGKGIGAIEAGRALFEQMAAADSGVTTALPALKTRLEGTRKQPEPYLVQEYLHENWHPLWCSRVMGELGRAKLGLGASATMAENLLPQLLPPKLQEVLAGHKEPRLREDLTDCLINQSFRRDLYVRGARQRHAGESAWKESFRFWQIGPVPTGDELDVVTAFGKVTLKVAGLLPLFEAVQGEGKSLAELTSLAEARGEAPQALQQKLALLLQAGRLSCSRRGQGSSGLAAEANVGIAALAATGAPYRFLAAGKLGSAIGCNDSEMLMLDAYLTDRQQFERAGPALLKERLARVGRRLAKDGQPLAGAEEEAEGQRMIETFATKTLPSWRRLGVID